MRLSTSRATTFLTCPRKFQHLYVDEREPREVDGNLSFGKAWHSIMEARWNGLLPVFAFSRESKIGPHEVAVLKTIYELYCGIYPLTEQLVEAEQGHVVALGDDELEVRLDAIVKVDGSTYVLEHKTTSSDLSGDFYWKQLMMDQQASWYYIAAQELGHDIEGIIWDVVRKPACRQTKRESREEYTQRCVDELNNNPEKYFVRGLVTRTETQLEEAKANFHDLCSIVKYGKFPQNTRSCFSWGRDCEYLPVCSHEIQLSDDRIYQLRQKPA